MTSSSELIPVGPPIPLSTSRVIGTATKQYFTFAFNKSIKMHVKIQKDSQAFFFFHSSSHVAQGLILSKNYSVFIYKG